MVTTHLLLLVCLAPLGNAITLREILHVLINGRSAVRQKPSARHPAGSGPHQAQETLDSWISRLLTLPIPSQQSKPPAKQTKQRSWGQFNSDADVGRESFHASIPHSELHPAHITSSRQRTFGSRRVPTRLPNRRQKQSRTHIQTPFGDANERKQPRLAHQTGFKVKHGSKQTLFRPDRKPKWHAAPRQALTHHQPTRHRTEWHRKHLSKKAPKHFQAGTKRRKPLYTFPKRKRRTY